MKLVKQLALACAVVLTAAGCSGGATSPSTTPSSSTTQAATTASVDASKPSYAYLGFGAVENCGDLAIIATRQYYAEYTHYVMTSYDGQESTQVFEAQEGYDLNDYAVVMKNQSGETLVVNASVGGKQIDAHYMSGYFEEGNLTDTYDSDRAFMQEAIAANDDSDTGLEFIGTNTGTIPLIDDGTEYEYYEFKNVATPDGAAGGTAANTANDATNSTELTRLYVKDGKLIAQVVELDSGQSVDVRYYHAITSEVPAGFIALPDTTGLERE